VALVKHDVQRLWRARMRGVRFDRTLTVGRLNVFLHPAELAALRAEVSGGQAPADVLKDYRLGDYADQFLRECLAASVTVLDASDYEGADRVHDLNQPLPADLHEQFDAVIEAGTLEHVFNFPVAIASLMAALKVGGTLFLTTPANNLCGHGFYQFSPEIMYRIFSAENGFAMRHVTFLEARFPAVESAPMVRVREVADPAIIGRRVGLRSRRPVMMAIEATRVERRNLFERAPLQSDYVARWQSGQEGRKGVLQSAFDALPALVRARVLGYYHLWEYSFFNRKAYKTTDPESGSRLK
jgi:SAM-dependent methyltransferase